MAMLGGMVMLGVLSNGFVSSWGQAYLRESALGDGRCEQCRWSER